MLDYVGRGLVIDDATKPETTTGHALIWLFSTPWWVPGTLATLITGVWLYYMLKAMSLNPTIDQPQPLPCPLIQPVLDSSVIQADGMGGRGGSGEIEGSDGTVKGGRGGAGGAERAGRGGDGGDVSGRGNNLRVIGGDGGNAGQPDGRGGPPASIPEHTRQLPTGNWGIGRGVAGRNHPEYTRRVELLIEIRQYYTQVIPDTLPFVLSGIDRVPIEFINKRLEEKGETWQVSEGQIGYVLPHL